MNLLIFLERTFCCKVKTRFKEWIAGKIFLERTFCCKVKTVAKVCVAKI